MRDHGRYYCHRRHYQVTVQCVSLAEEESQGWLPLVLTWAWASGVRVHHMSVERSAEGSYGPVG